MNTLSLAPLAALLNKIEHIGIALCQVETNKQHKIIAIHCKEANQQFTNFLGIAAGSLDKLPLHSQYYDFIAVVNDLSNKARPLLIKENEFIKVEFIKGAEENQMLVLLESVTNYIEHYKLEITQQVQHQLSNFADQSSLPMMVSNLKDQIAFNDAYVALFGYNSKEELQAIAPQDLSPEFQPNGKRSSELMAGYMMKAQKEGFVQFEWTHLKKDKTPLPLEININFMVINNMPIINAVLRDLTEIKKLEAENKREQERLINEISTPILPIFKDIILLPLIGTVTEERAHLASGLALKKVFEMQSRTIIIDVSGVNAANLQVAVMCLLKLAGGAYLMGCHTILCGLSSELAQGIVDLNIDLTGVIATGTLEEALKTAIKMTYK